MTLYAGMLFLQATLLVSLITPTEYSSPPPAKFSSTCYRKYTECGQFKQPYHDVGSYKCKLNNKCDYSCVFSCPKNKWGIPMVISDKHLNKEIYTCSNNIWQPRDIFRAFCVAEKPVVEVHQNFPNINRVNNLIGALFNTSYVYLAMASFYERADVALPGFSNAMTKLWESEVKHARDFMSYVNKRGGYLHLIDIPSPSLHEALFFSSRPGLDGLDFALKVTRDVNDLAVNLLKTTTQRQQFRDPHLKYILESGIISHKTDTIKKLADLIRQLRSFANEDYDIGEYLIDLEISRGEHQLGG